MKTAPDLPYHEVSTLFPLMIGDAFADLKVDIAEHGQREPAWVYQGAIIDGRNRARACKELGRPLQTREWDGDERDLVPFVVSLNLKRRHLDESQRAAIAAKLANLKIGDNQHCAKGAQICAPSGGREVLPIGRTSNAPPSNGKPAAVPISQKQAAALLNVSTHSVGRAAVVQSKGVPELNQLVEDGEASVAAAELIAGLPKGEQKTVVAGGSEAVKQKAAEMRRERKPREPDLTYSWPKSIQTLYEQFNIVGKKGLDTLLEEWDRELAEDYLRTLKDVRARCDVYIPKIERSLECRKR
jgi:hypothetical protein